ncbi:GNAT family N-acetyltransferase [Roseiconus lacunae]|uniref:Alpha/beta hydrolase n=1 Tax=Roseiconus lacunae TaxID=2605694 RepID=A0ABT7PPT2_9BACT|nr:GNAT family N-acetyltransferase [Roseiconus lacunae]MDM4018504.1 alpha/beta hydrolase [Roseiconus lacunae]
MAKKQLRGFERQIHLHYLWECELGGTPPTRERDVRLGVGDMPYALDEIQGHFSNLPYRNAHRLEGRHPDSVSGAWGISFWRSEKMYGNVPRQYLDDNTKFEDVSSETWRNARAFRKLCYYRVTKPEEAIHLLNNEREVRFACEVTSSWYDPPGGLIPPIDESSSFVSSHAVPLSLYDPETSRFIFPNSWGTDWGKNGWGQLPVEHWENCVVSAWDTVCAGMVVPTKAQAGIIVRGWKWGLDLASGVHAIEIYDVDKDEYLAWAFCVIRNGRLDVDEFFVRPEERGKGYARELCSRLQQLAKDMGKEIRLVVGFADTEDYTIDGTEAIARLLGLQLFEADVRWASKFALADAPETSERSWKPDRPASIWELLRPRDEPPIEEPKQFTVFYGTNREPNDVNDLSKGYSNRRGYELRRGSCLVEIPKTFQFGHEGRSFLSRLKPGEGDTRRVIGTQGWAWDEIIRFAKVFVSKAKADPYNLLFIHGYQNSFDAAAIRAGQLGLDLKVPGATFFYSWPSTENPIGYNADEAAHEYSIDFCHEYVKDILLGFPDVPLHIIAHSMGNRVAIGLFERLSQEVELPGKLGQLVFAAADVDVDRFRQSVANVRHLPRRMTAYVARGDGALLLSLGDHWAPRVGLAPPITCVAGVDTILVEGFSATDLSGHAYFVDEPPVIYDMFCLLRHGSDPNNRAKVVEEFDSSAESTFWSLSLK